MTREEWYYNWRYVRTHTQAVKYTIMQPGRYGRFKGFDYQLPMEKAYYALLKRDRKRQPDLSMRLAFIKIMRLDFDDWQIKEWVKLNATYPHYPKVKLP